MMFMRGAIVACAVAGAASRSVARTTRQSSPIENCPGYHASNINIGDSFITADLTLAGPPCNTYGTDLTDLKLEVNFETESRLHIQIYDKAQNVYQVPESVFPRPGGSVSADDSTLAFSYTLNPFSFAVSRKGSDGPALFNTSGTNLVFQSQYLRLRTTLPQSPNLYGLGEHTNTFHLPTDNFIRTLWDVDNPWVPPGENLYGSHPVYFDHRGSDGTHGVFLLNSNGMDIMINNTAADGQYLEYNTLGGIVDLYVMSGPEPEDVSMQYAEIVGLPAMIPYWSLGYHQCKYGYQDIYEVAEVVANYSAAGIPLETMWDDIDYMDLRKDFTTDPDRYPLSKFRELITYLHDHQQHSVLMTDPTIPQFNYGPYNRGVEEDVFLKQSNGSLYINVMWPGAVAIPDWFTPNVSSYWTNEILDFFDPNTGIDIDGIWIDMNEDSVFCPYPCNDPAGWAAANGDPPTPPPVRNSSGRVIPGFPPDFQPPGSNDISKSKRANGPMLGLSGRDLINPPYKIHNVKGALPNNGIATDIQHVNGLVEYDTHNLFGLMMSQNTRTAMLARRPGRRPLIISRSTWAGTGKYVGHWTGDNASNWTEYRFSMSGLLQFASLYQVPMVGSDVCGFNNNTWETICARWAMLGAFSPFYRNHADISAAHQEFYLWPTVAEAARIAIDARFRLLDYIYTAFQRQTKSGSPLITPLWFKYPTDANTFSIDLQYFYGDSILVSPVTGDEATSVDIYLPNEIFYDFWTSKPVVGKGTTVTLSDVPFTSIPLHIRGGSVVPLRVSGANTTTELRKKDFYLIVAPGVDGTASGMLYLDDGESVDPSDITEIRYSYDGSQLSCDGTFDYDPGVQISYILLLGASSTASAERYDTSYDSTNQTLTVEGPFSLTGSWSLQMSPR